MKLRQNQKGSHTMDHDHHHAGSDIPAGTETAKDPVCGMKVAVRPDGRHAEFGDKTFHFCSEKCQTKFKRDRARCLPDLRHGAGADAAN